MGRVDNQVVGKIAEVAGFGSRVTRYFVRPDRPRSWDFVLQTFFVISGVAWLASGVISNNVASMAIGALWVAGWGFRLSLDVIALRAKPAQTPTPRPPHNR
jgi:hypothetical protein